MIAISCQNGGGGEMGKSESADRCCVIEPHNVAIAVVQFSRKDSMAKSAKTLNENT